MSTISILNQEITDEEGTYRIRVGDHVGYLTIPTDVFDEDTMCQPRLLIPQLPQLPKEPWTRISITRPKEGPHAGDLVLSATNDPLREIKTAWHPTRIDVLSLEQTEWHRSNVREVLYNGIPAISKIANFEWTIPRHERESWAYGIIDACQDALGEQIAPKVLGHLTECGRVVGLLLEKVEGGFAGVEDLPMCADVLRKLHGIDLMHGDVNRYNFVVDREKKRVVMVDFEWAADLEEDAARAEIESLAKELVEDTGRGGPPRVVA